MSRSSVLCQLALVAVVAGCSVETESVVPASIDPTVQAEPGEGAEAMTFVSLKVPNMV